MPTTINSSTVEPIIVDSSAIPLDAATEPTTVEPSSAEFTAFVFKQLRCAKLRAEITVNQTEMAMKALNAGILSPEMAILILAECGSSF
jgi:hypothetical protein